MPKARVQLFTLGWRACGSVTLGSCQRHGHLLRAVQPEELVVRREEGGVAGAESLRTQTSQLG